MPETRTLLTAAREAVRRSSNAADDEITLLIRAGVAEMTRKGIVMKTTTDADISETVEVENVKPLLTRALMLYCQFSFGMDGDVDKKQRLERLFQQLTTTLALSEEYNEGGESVG